MRIKDVKKKLGLNNGLESEAHKIKNIMANEIMDIQLQTKRVQAEVNKLNDKIEGSMAYKFAKLRRLQ